MLYLAKGKFPWTADRGTSKAKIDDIIFVKQNYKSEELFDELPSIINHVTYITF